MDEVVFKALSEKVGQDATAAINKAMLSYEEKAKAFANGVADKTISKDAFEQYQKAAKDTMDEVKTIVEKQGSTMQDIALKINSANAGTKSIAEVLNDDREEIMQIKRNGAGNKTYMISLNEKGQFVMKPHDMVAKTVGPVATISGINGGTAASIFQSIDATTLLRIAGDAPIFNQFRNSRWVFDLCRVVNAGWDQSYAVWYEEVTKTGASATVAEGALKPYSQYGYTAKTQSYKKEATIIGFSDEFSLDFQRLQSDILGQARIDVINRINTAVLADIIAAATAYNTAASYKTARGGAITNDSAHYNDYIAIDALAAQVDNATFGQQANAAIMSTFRNHALNTQLDANGRFLMPPALLQNLSWVGNPAMAVDDVIVGDFKEYNIILRGGLIVRVGMNGTDFAQNMFSVAVEQYYFDYITAIRAVAIVKGATFAAVKTALTT